MTSHAPQSRGTAQSKRLQRGKLKPDWFPLFRTIVRDKLNMDLILIVLVDAMLPYQHLPTTAGVETPRGQAVPRHRARSTMHHFVLQVLRATPQSDATGAPTWVA